MYQAPGGGCDSVGAPEFPGSNPVGKFNLLSTVLKILWIVAKRYTEMVQFTDNVLYANGTYLDKQNIL